MMIAIRHSGTGEVQFVASLTGYGPEWAQLGGAVPEGAAPGDLVLIDGVWVDDLPALRARAVIAIDAAAEAARMRFLTPGQGQAMTYQRKEAEARAWLVDNDVEAPFLAAEAAARGMTIAALAAEVVALADRWAVVGSTIEGLRMGAKAAVTAAGTRAAIEAATDVDWGAIVATP
ncbi:hypothetical protein COA17_11025 [Sphingomonas ginsenosidimutans]|jgi:hypothetical protein|uniref:DUF4376 domain-containing protein n=1 Tax=Sphingomonas ginsenosidimutans TaxID=862134 RepID=A0A2A4HXC2_9SPHN|nr:hypothetical protein [Sphingomonas ginsenosidimutans]PCG08681.1 hypothetical protein COA17_11025 [Sphingomonas ginsenosidimutans]